MASGTLTDRSTGQTITASFWNDIHGALDGDFVGRNASGIATSGQNLGTSSIPWGAIRGSSLVLGGTAVDTSTIASPVNRIVSGKKRSTSNQPAYITPNGAAASFLLAGATINLVVDVNGSAVTANTDITKSSLTVAPSSNNTCLVNDAAAAAQMDTRTWGEVTNVKTIAVDTMGSGISALVGKWAVFKLAGGSTEYFLAFVNSTTELTKCYRGFFYDSSLAPVNRTTFSDNNIISLMSLGWVFLQSDGVTLDVTYNNPIWNFVTPAGPATGDYWYDLGNSEWKRYDGSAFQVINRTWVGLVVIDTSNCVAARCVDFYANYKDTDEIDIEVSTSQIIRAIEQETRVNVAGVDLRFRESIPSWNITTDLAGSADMISSTLQASRMYYLYFKDTGATVISDIQPYYRRDLIGFYHPHNPWRCIGQSYSNGSSNLVTSAKSILPLSSRFTRSVKSVSANYTATKFDDLIQASGAAFTVTLPLANEMVGKQLTIKKTDSSLTNIITVSRAAADTLEGNTTITLLTRNEFVTLINDGVSNWSVLQIKKAPTQQLFTSGSSATYTTPTTPTPNYLRVKMVGGGAGGGGGGTIGGSAPSGASGGGTTTFGTSLLTCTGGSSSNATDANSTVGGTATITSPAFGTATTGGCGNGGSAYLSTGAGNYSGGGMGGNSILAGSGGGGGAGGSQAGRSAGANTGSGGGGGGGAADGFGGGGGAAGGGIDAIITSPSATYTYTIGAAGTGGTAGTNGFSGGAGSAGYIEITEVY